MTVEIPKFRDFREISIFLGHVIEKGHTLTLLSSNQNNFPRFGFRVVDIKDEKQ